MKRFPILLALAVASPLAFADCTLSIPQPKDGGMSVTYLGKHRYHKIRRVMESKGYQVVDTDEPTTYTLDVWGSYGYGCGNGLTWVDYLSVPASFSLHFKGPGINIDAKDEIQSLFFIKSREFHQLMKAVRALPECQ